MKKLAILLIVAIVGLFTACKDFIDPQPRVDLLIETYYRTEAHFFDALIAAYDPLQWTFIDGVWTSNVMLGEIRSDNMRAGGDPSNADQPGWQAIDDFQNTTLTLESETFWKRGWWGIYRTNLLINNDNLDTDNVRLFKAEAKFLRAWYHFDLFRVFGPIPFLDEVLTEADYIGIQRLPVSELFRRIKEDLRDAIELLPQERYTGAFLGRTNKTTAQAVLGKVLLYEADILNDNIQLFAEAADVLREVIGSGQFRLLDDYADLFAFNAKNTEESIFEIQYTNLLPRGWGDGQFIAGNTITQLVGIRGLCSTHPLWLPGWGFMLPTNSLFNHYLPDDTYRRRYSIVSIQDLQGIGCNVDLSQQNQEDFSGYWQHKYANFRSYTNPNGGEIVLQKDPNEPVIRYADALLMCAEAIIRSNGSQAEAFDYINQVRRRAAGPNAATYKDAAQIMAENSWTPLDLIWYERRAELAGEGDRWFDLVRSGRANAQIFAADDYRRGNINPDQLYLAIPQRDIDNTGGSLTAFPSQDLFR
jgi:starch-binding outer membrane protein, SusD/RagB family